MDLSDDSAVKEVEQLLSLNRAGKLTDTALVGAVFATVRKRKSESGKVFKM